MSEILQVLTDEFVNAFTTAISEPRFKPYYRIYPSVSGKKPQERDKLDAIAIYMWNMALCESLYPTFHMAEVVFRNALNNALSTLKNTPMWYQDVFLLEPNQQERIVEAEEELRSAHKPIFPSRMVAELSFGFWVTLYSDKYLQKIGHPTIQHVFPNLHPKFRKHATVQRRLQRVRALRNRVFHHEPIWHWPDLHQQYEETLELILWMNRAALKFHSQVDRFETVHQGGWQPYRQKLDLMLEGDTLEQMLEEDQMD